MLGALGHLEVVVGVESAVGVLAEALNRDGAGTAPVEQGVALGRDRVAFDALFLDGPMSALDLRHIEVQNRAGMVELRLLRAGQHEANSSAVQKCHAACGEQQGQAQSISVKSGSAFPVVYMDRDLQAGDANAHGCGRHRHLPARQN